MDPAGAGELHLPGGATSLRDSIKDGLSPVPWPVPARRDLGAGTRRVREPGEGWDNRTPNFGGDSGIMGTDPPCRCPEGMGRDDTSSGGGLWSWDPKPLFS